MKQAVALYLIQQKDTDCCNEDLICLSTNVGDEQKNAKFRPMVHVVTYASENASSPMPNVNEINQ